MVDVSFSEILNFPILCSSFKKFVETEFCVEPLMFWCVATPSVRKRAVRSS